MNGNLSLYQIQTRVALSELGEKLGRKATLDDIPDQDLDHLAERGFDWIWYLGIWQTGAAGRNISESHFEWQVGFRGILPDLQPSDISGSPFAITGYVAHSDFGGPPALARLRERLHQRGMRLMLDFVANHTAPDHPWVQAHPEFYVAGDEEKLRREPHNYVRTEMRDPQILAYGRDPYFSGWPDTLQLNYAQPSLQAAMRQELLSVASQCDGVRCDMAMLLLPEIFERTWGLRAEPFWPEAIGAVRREHPEFVFMAEVCWGLEWTLQQQGFDYTYDKELYDRLRSGNAGSIREHFSADLSFQQKSARFLENHDEPRAAAVFSWEMHQPAAVLTYLSPGLRFFHDGQLEGRGKRLSVHLGRGPMEQAQPVVKEFYDQLLRCVQQPVARYGQWRMLNCSAASEGNWTWDCFVCFLWEVTSEPSLLVAVNYSGNQSQCYAHLPIKALWAQMVRGQDLLSSAVHEERCDAGGRLFLDLPPWHYRVLALTAG